MITISTGGIGPMDITANPKSKGASKEEKAVDAFASLMNMVSAKQDNGDMVSNADVDVTDVAPQKDVSKEYEAYSRQESVDASDDRLQNTEKTVAKEDTEASKAKGVDEGLTDEQVTDKVVILVKQVKDALKEKLGLSDEQIDSLLADMGILAPELLVGDNLKNFVLQAQGATNVDLLVNENLSKLVTDITNELSRLMLNSGLEEGFDVNQFINDNAVVINEVLEKIDAGADIIIDGNVTDKSLNETDNYGKLHVETKQTEQAVVESSSREADDGAVEQLKSSEKQLGDLETTEEQSKAAVKENMTVDTGYESGRQMGQEQGFEQSNQQIQTNFNQALDNVANTNVDVASFAGNVTEADIIRQIIDQIKVNVGEKMQSVEVQLNPENLGKVYVNVEAKDGVMQAKIVAETEAAKNAIENNLAILKENFSNNEIKVEAIEVMVAAYGFFEESQNGDFDNQEQANDTSKAIGSLNVGELNEDELTEEEAIEVEMMRTKGNTVSYTV